jgi:tRNA(fMet)-specific endonuclease VapC
MARLMLDTNICIHVLKRNDPIVIRNLERTRPRDVTISSVVAAELWTGVMKSRERRRNEDALNEFLDFVEVLDWPARAAQVYGTIRTQLESKGRLIGAMDLLIAAHAVYEGATLVTRNIREFARVERLTVESWSPSK